VSVSTYRKLM